MVLKHLWVDYDIVVTYSSIKTASTVFLKLWRHSVRTVICISELIYSTRLWKSSPCETIKSYVDENSEIPFSNFVAT